MVVHAGYHLAGSNKTANFHYRRRLPDAVRRAGEGGGREKGPAELIYQSLSCDFAHGAKHDEFRKPKDPLAKTLENSY